MTLPRIAVLVDGDNIPDKQAAQILQFAKNFGRIDVARVYATTGHLSQWINKPGFRYIATGKGKNATDILLSIDAMHLALKSGIEGFAIATSDGDFAHLAERLREYGLPILGLGETKAPKKFRAAVTEFKELGSTNTTPIPTGQPGGRKSNSKITKLDQAIKDLIAINSQNGAGMLISTMGAQMGKSGVRISTYPEKTWRGYLGKRTALFDMDPQGPNAHVRFIPTAFAPN